jgi:choline kinase
MDPGKADGEHVGMAKFGAAGARLLVNCLDALVAAGHSRDSAPRSFRCFARRRRLETVGTRGYPWIAIDRPEDRERAEREVLPAIEQLPEPAPVAGTAD